MTTPTKTYYFDDETLAALKKMVITETEDGFLGVIEEQLDRKLYDKVAKAIASLEGKWVRQKKGHVFKKDPRLAWEEVIENGEITVQNFSFFPTPRDVVEGMLRLAPIDVDHSLIILEPSAGEGAILELLFENSKIIRHIVDYCELNEDRRQILAARFPDAKLVGTDFLDYELPTYISSNEPQFRYTRIFMNPPFENGQDIEHIYHAYDLLAPDGILVAVMMGNITFREDKKYRNFQAFLHKVGGTVIDVRKDAFTVKTKIVKIHKKPGQAVMKQTRMF